MHIMSNRSFLAVFVFIIVISLKLIKSESLKGHGEWTHEVNLESEHGIVVKWMNSPASDDAEGNKWLTMQVFAKTKGYVGVGFSPHGGMANSDIVIGWVDTKTGKAHLKDYHALANEQPILDAQQDYELISAKEDEEGTTLQFRRKWETCDSNDMMISNDTMRLIWAYSPFDPVLSDDGNTVSSMQWHGTKSRGAKSTYVIDNFSATEFPRDDDPNVKHWDMLMENNVVEAEYTTYFCKILKLPPLEGKHQMIGYKPILQKETKENVHHIVFYECVIPSAFGNTSQTFEKYVGDDGGRCYTPNMPPVWAKHCVTFLFVWVKGSEGEMLPTHVGTPLGEEHGGSTYFMLELHYDNPELKTFTDSSGVRIYYTDKLREYDGAVLLMGYRITPFLLLPPKQDNFITYGLCSRECTEKAIPEEGINIIISLVHAHLTGRKIRLRHFRNGKELPLIAEDNHYDFNFQQSKPLKNEVTILRGDELTVECEYSTKDNDRMVLGGFSTTEEMCQVFLMYYPRIDLMQCTSQVEYSDFFKALNVDEVSGSVLTKLKMPYKLPPPDQYFDAPDDAKEVEAFADGADGASFNNFFDQINIEKPSHLKGETVGAYLRRGNWTRKSKEIESAWKNSKHYAFCTGHGRKRVPLQNHIISYPRITEPLKPPPSVCSKKDGFAYNEPRRNRNNLATSAVSKILTTTQVHAFMSGWLLFMTRLMSL